MKIDPYEERANLIFCNNLCLMLLIFAIACFITSMYLMQSGSMLKTYKYANGMITDPIVVKDANLQVYRVKIINSSYNQNTYITGEVLNDKNESVYKFGKELWHESGSDMDGYWSESDREMQTELTFKEKGSYRIKFTHTGSLSQPSISITIFNKVKSYVAFVQAGFAAFILAAIAFCILNIQWIHAAIAGGFNAVSEGVDD